MSRTSQPSSLKDRMRRADALRPWVKQQIEEATVRAIAEASGLSRTVLHDFVEGGKTPQEKNLHDIEVWAAGRGYVFDVKSGGSGTGSWVEGNFGSGKSHQLMAMMKEMRDPYGMSDDSLLRDLWSRLDAIDAMEDLTPVQREMRQERELAAYRTTIHDREARTAAMRVRAIEREAEVAASRTRAVEPPPAAVAPVVPSQPPADKKRRRA